jgi:hypothetical protein
MKKYSLLYFQQTNDKFSKWIFPLHDGENVIGSDKEVDIFLYLNEKEELIDSVHCKIIVNEFQNDVGIISLASNGHVKRGEGNEKIILSPGKEYELNNKTVFYLTDNIKFMLIKGTIDEIHDYFLDENLENEFQKWHQFIIAQESNMKINLNLTRKESYNKSFVSNNDMHNNNSNININNSVNNNNLMNSAASNKNINNNISNSIMGSNSKEVNRIGFNNFDEVPEDTLINDYKASTHNPINLINNKNIKSQIINISPYKQSGKDKDQNNEDNNKTNNNTNNNNYNYKHISTDITNNNIIINEKESEKNSIKLEMKNDYNKNINDKENKTNYEVINLYQQQNNENNNLLDFFKQASSEFKKNNNDKNINKDEKTIQTIKELLGENNLEIIFNNTNYKNIKKYDIIFKKSKNNIKGKSGARFGNFDIQVKNDFLKNNIKYHKNKIKNNK